MLAQLIIRDLSRLARLEPGLKTPGRSCDRLLDSRGKPSRDGAVATGFMPGVGPGRFAGWVGSRDKPARYGVRGDWLFARSWAGCRAGSDRGINPLATVFVATG